MQTPSRSKEKTASKAKTRDQEPAAYVDYLPATVKVIKNTDKVLWQQYAVAK